MTVSHWILLVIEGGLLLRIGAMSQSTDSAAGFYIAFDIAIFWLVIASWVLS